MLFDRRARALRGAALGTALSLLLSSPGFQPYQALAQSLTPPPRSSTVGSLRSVALPGYSGSFALGNGAASLTLNSARLSSVGLGASLEPSRATGQSLAAYSGVVSAAAQTAAPAAQGTPVPAESAGIPIQPWQDSASAEQPRGKTLAAFIGAQGETPARSETTMGRLVAAAVQIPGLLSLSDPTLLKDRAGRIFEQGRIGTGLALSVPEFRQRGNFRLRRGGVLLRGGHSQNLGVPELVRSFKSAYAEDVPPWVRQALPYAAALSLPVLAHFVPITLPFTAGFVLSLLAVHDTGHGPAERQEGEILAAAERHARQGLQLLRSENFARALHHFDAAYRQVKALPGAEAPNSKARELWALRNNAALDLLRDALRRAQENPGLASEEQIDVFQRASRELAAEDFRFTGDHSPKLLDEDITDALRLAASWLQPMESDNRVSVGETAHGLQLLREFVKGLARGNPAPGEGLLEAVGSAYGPGQRIGLDFMTETARRLKLGDQPWPALDSLVRSKRAARFSNGSYIYLAGLEDGAQEPKDPDLREARRLAREGLDLLTRESVEDHARALYFLYTAQGFLEKYRRFHEESDAMQRQVEVLTDNAALQLLYDIVNSYGEDQPQGSLLARLPNIPPDALAGLHNYFQREYAAVGHDPKPLTQSQKDLLVSALTRMSANMQERARVGQIPHEEEIADGLSLLFEGLRESPLRSGERADENSPTPEQVGFFLAAMDREGYKPGSRVEADRARLMTGEAGAKPQQAAAWLRHLAQKGHLLALHGDKGESYIFADLRTEEESVSKYAEAKVADSLAREGMELLSKAEPSLADRARALSLFHEALQKYATYSRRHTVDHPHVEQVEVLENNAAIGLLTAMLGEFDRQISQSNGSARMDNYKSDLRTVLPRLRGVFYDIHAKSHDFEPEVPELLEAYLKLGHSKSPGAMSDDPQVRDGVRILRRFFNSESSDGEEEPGQPAPEIQRPPYNRSSSQWQAVPGKGNEALYNLGRNLTQLAADNKLDPLIGREDELEEVIQILGRRMRNNPILTGPEGVGKTAIIEGLAQRIVSGDVPEYLQGVNIFILSPLDLVAGSKFRGSFEERLKAVTDSVRRSKGKILVFIDELHNLKGLGAAEGGPDAVQLLKTPLSRGELPMIGTTTPDFYQKIIEKDGALKRRFEEVKVAPVTPKQAVEILKGLRQRYQDHHKVTISDEVLEDTVRLASRYVWNENLPDSALGIMDSAMAKASIRAYRAERAGSPSVRTVTVGDIAEVIEKKTRIPVRMGGDAIQEMQTLPKRLKGHVIGQDHVIDEIAVDLQAARSGTKDPKRPTTFVFAGPTGVGKTELARAISTEFFDSPDQFVQIDMSEYQEAHSVSGLIGAPPGYVRSDEEGALTGPVRRVPYLVVLLDEIEEANPAVWKLLLQIMEDGWIHDKLGRKVYFKHAVLIMTTNIGADKDQPEGFGFGRAETAEVKEADELTPDDLRRLRDLYSEELAKHFPAKFFGRVSEHIHAFRRLGSKELEQVLDLRMADVNRHLGSEKKGMNATLTDAARAHILSYSAGQRNWQVGARLIREVTWTRVSRALVEAELAGLITERDAVEVDYDAGLKKLVARKKAAPEGPPIRTTMGAYLGLALPLAAIALPAEARLLLVAITVALLMIYLLARMHMRALNGRLANKPAWSIPVWLPTFLGLGILFFVLDWSSKYLFVVLGFPVKPHDMEGLRLALFPGVVAFGLAFYTYYLKLVHSVSEPFQWLAWLRQKLPALGYPLYGLLQLLTFPLGIHRLHAGDLAQRHPSVRRALALFGITAAAVIGAVLGNGLQGMLDAQVADFIPFGHGRMNFADIYAFFGLPIIWRTMDFFRAARQAENTNQPITPKTWKYYLLPALGLVGFFFTTWEGYAMVPVLGWYVCVYSILFLVGTIGADLLIQPHIRAFNANFKKESAPGGAP